MTFTVDPDVVRQAAADLDHLGTALGHARNYLNEHVRVGAGNGTVLAAIGSRLDSVRDQLDADYSPTGVARRAYTHSADALFDMARDYERTDEQVAADVDADMPGTSFDELSGPTTYMPPEFSVGEFQALLVTPEEGFGPLDVYNDVASGIDYVLGFDWVGGMVHSMGIPDPFSGLKDQLEGDWETVGKAVGGLGCLAAFWDQLAGTTRTIPNRFSWQRVPTSAGDTAMPYDSWSGRGADSATHFMQTLADKGIEHKGALDGTVTAITGWMFAVNDALQQLIGLVEDLLSIMPWGQSLEDFLESAFMPWKNVDRLIKIAGICGKMLTKVRLVLDAFAVVVALIGELQSALGVDFPQVDPYAGADVDG